MDTVKVSTEGGEKILGSFGRTSIYSTFNDMLTIGVFPKIPSTICSWSLTLWFRDLFLFLEDSLPESRSCRMTFFFISSMVLFFKLHVLTLFSFSVNFFI